MRINETIEKSGRCPIARFVTPGRLLAPIAVAVAVLSCPWLGCSREDSFPPLPYDIHESTPSILYAIDVQTGSEVWRRGWDDNVPLPIVAAEGRLYYCLVDAQNASVYAFEGKSGKAAWRTPYAWETGPRGYPGTLLAEGDVLYCVGIAGRIDAIETLSGSLRWNRTITERATSLPTANSEGLMLATSETEIVLLDKETGRARRTFGMGQKRGWEGHFTSDRWLFFCYDSIVAVPPDGKQATWQFPPGYPADSWGSIGSPLFDDRQVYLGSTTGELIILDAESGQISARIRHGMYDHVNLALAGGIVYVRGWSNGTIAALDLHTKDVKWRRRFAWAVGSQSQLVIDGDVLCFTGGRRVQAVDRNTGRDLWHVVTEHNVYTADIPFDGKRIYIIAREHP